MRDSYYRAYAAACEGWPTDSLPRDMLDPIKSGVPALAISGEVDPATPPSLGEETLAQFVTRVHVVVPDGYHTNSANPCVAGIMAAFIANPALGGRDHECLERAVPKPRFHVAGGSEEVQR